MNTNESLRSLRSVWLNRAVAQLAKGASLREDFRDQLEKFFDALEQAIDTGEPVWLESILNIWSSSLTQTDLEIQQSSLTTFIKELFLLTIQLCHESLEPSEAVGVLTAIVPPFAYAFEKVSHYEIEARVLYLTHRLAEVQSYMQSLDRAKSDFVAVAAHELRTPLTLVEGYAAMLQDTLLTPENRLQMLNGIQNGANRLRIIIDDMIDVSLIDNNLLKLNFQPTWLNRIFNGLNLELTPTLKERNQELTIQSFPGSTELIYADPERIYQLFRNLLLNSIKFTPDSGHITITGRKLPGFIEIIIIDTGIGISPEGLNMLFTKFSRLDNSLQHSSGKTKFKGGGPGLGLHIARGIIEAHEGAIWAESPGRDEQTCPGSTFHVLLPLRTQPPDGKAAALFSQFHQSSLTQ
jgi:signal transduction histidine kinase